MARSPEIGLSKMRNPNSLIGRSANFLLLLLMLCKLQDYAVCEAPEEWERIAQEELRQALNTPLLQNRAKNVVFFLGDGMGLATITAGRILKGQLAGKTGEETKLIFENFPHVGLCKVYNDDYQTPDSAGTGVAFLCGQKAARGVIGVNSKVKFGDCKSSLGNDITSLMTWAQKANKSTGLVTTTRITHATPANTFAHSPHRDWEADSDMPEEARKECRDIAIQLIQDAPGKNINVVFGGGRNYFIPNTEKDPLTGEQGLRLDGNNLLNLWMAQKRAAGFGDVSFLVNTTKQLNNLDAKQTKYAFGLFSSSHMEYELNRPKQPEQPSLKLMVKKAIEILKKEKNGFFLFVEGGMIDQAHHHNHPKLALGELIAMDDALKTAMQMLPGDETLFVGNPILGFAGVALDNMPYSTLTYANGPNTLTTMPRPNLTGVDFESNDYAELTLVPMDLETHGGEDIAVYAKGPWSHLFHTTHEQHFVAHAIDYAACYRSQNASHCKQR